MPMFTDEGNEQLSNMLAEIKEVIVKHAKIMERSGNTEYLDTAVREYVAQEVSDMFTSDLRKK